MKRLVWSVCLCLASLPAAAQETPFDPAAFEKELRGAIDQAPLRGVKILKWSDQTPAVSYLDSLKRESLNPPDHGFVALDSNDKPVDVFGSGTPYEVQGNKIVIPGYDLPAGGKIATVGQVGWANAVQTATADQDLAVDSGIQQAISRIELATDFIAERMCGRKSHPTKIVLNLTAGFELVFSAQTGSQVEWDLETVCARFR